MRGPFSKIIEKHAQEIPDQPAYIFFDQPTTWAQFNEQIDRVVGSLMALGLKKGDKIATLLPQSPAFSTMYMAAAKLGLVVIPLDPRFKAGEMNDLCQRTSPRILVGLAFPEEIKAEVQGLLKLYKFEAVYSYFGQLEGAKPYEALLEAEPAQVPADQQPSGDDPLIVIFTSGTTGRPKGAVISHANSWGMARDTCEVWDITRQDTVLCNMPTSHVAGTHDILAAQFYGGATGIVTPKFDPQETLELIQKYNITYTGGVPTMYRLILKNADSSKVDLSSVRCIVVSGEPSTPELIRQINAAFPKAKIVASWGMSETTGFFTFTTLEDTDETVEQTEGKPAPGLEMKIMGPGGEELPMGGVGEMWVRGHSVIKGYMDPEDDKSTFVDGWLRTGDLGSLDERGYLHFVGRIKEMYISGGYNVYPLEIESFLNRYPGVNTSAVVEIPDPVWGEVGVAFVIPEPGKQLTIEELDEYCKKGLSGYKRPRKIIIEEDVPRSLIGKIAKKELRQVMTKFLD